MPPRRRRTMQDGDATEGEAPAVSDNFVIDFSQVEELDDKPMPIGEYQLEVTRAQLTKNDDGKPLMKVSFLVSDVENEANVDQVGRKLQDWIYLNKDSLWRAKKAFRALGFDVAGALTMQEIAEQLPGKKVWVLTKTDKLPRDGRKVTRVSRYFVEGEDEEDEDGDTQF